MRAYAKTCIQSFVREVESNVSVTIVSTPGVAVCRVCDILCFVTCDDLGMNFRTRIFVPINEILLFRDLGP